MGSEMFDRAVGSGDPSKLKVNTRYNVRLLRMLALTDLCTLRTLMSRRRTSLARQPVSRQWDAHAEKLTLMRYS